MTGTVDGDVILWDEQTSPVGRQAPGRRASKVVRIHNSPITFLSDCEQFVVSGGGDGYVRFYDPKLRLVAWFEV